MGYQTSLSIVFSAFRILLLELFLARQSLSTLLRSCMSSIGCQLKGRIVLPPKTGLKCTSAVALTLQQTVASTILPFKMRIRFKLLLLVYQCVQQTAPTYLCERLHEKKKSKYGIRSYELEHLHIPDSETRTYGDRAFCFSGPREWNKLSLEIRQSKSMEVFKTKIKNFAF